MGKIFGLMRGLKPFVLGLFVTWRSLQQVYSSSASSTHGKCTSALPDFTPSRFGDANYNTSNMLLCVCRPALASTLCSVSRCTSKLRLQKMTASHSTFINLYGVASQSGFFRQTSLAREVPRPSDFSGGTGPGTCPQARGISRADVFSFPGP
jgi:hypothetical protein